MAGKEESRIFVGGLSWETDERKLEDTFRRFGKVIDAQVSRLSPRFSASACIPRVASYYPRHMCVFLWMALLDLCNLWA